MGVKLPLQLHFQIMPEIIWVDDVPMPAMMAEEYQEEPSEHYEDAEWYNDPNNVMSHWHY